MFTVIRGGVVGEIFDFSAVAYDPLAEFRKDPVARLFQIAKDQGYRLMDLFKDFDKDGNHEISRDEFVAGIKVRTKLWEQNHKNLEHTCIYKTLRLISEYLLIPPLMKRQRLHVYANI